MKKIIILLISLASMFNVLVPVEAYSQVEPRLGTEERRATTYTKNTLLDSGYVYNQFVSYIKPYNIWTGGLDYVYISNTTKTYNVSVGFTYGFFSANATINNLSSGPSSGGIIDVSGKTFRIYATADFKWEYYRVDEYDAYTNQHLRTFNTTATYQVGKYYVVEER